MQQVPKNDFKFHTSNPPKRKYISIFWLRFGWPQPDVTFSRHETFQWTGRGEDHPNRCALIIPVPHFKNSIDPSSLSWPWEVMWNSWTVITMPAYSDSECIATFGRDMTQCLYLRSSCVWQWRLTTGELCTGVSVPWDELNTPTSADALLSPCSPAGEQLFNLMDVCSIWIPQITAVKMNGYQ